MEILLLSNRRSKEVFETAAAVGGWLLDGLMIRSDRQPFEHILCMLYEISYKQVPNGVPH